MAAKSVATAKLTNENFGECLRKRWAEKETGKEQSETEEQRREATGWRAAGFDSQL